jgi:hypothetical protein
MAVPGVQEGLRAARPRRRTPEFITGDSQGLEFEVEWKAFGVTGEDQSAPVDGSEELPNRSPLGAVGCGSEPYVDGVVGHSDSAGRREDVGDDLLRFARSSGVRGDQRCEIGFRVCADDADHVDDGLELAGVADELASDRRVLDGGMGRGLRPECFEVALKLKCLGEVLFYDGSA